MNFTWTKTTGSFENGKILAWCHWVLFWDLFGLLGFLVSKLADFLEGTDEWHKHSHFTLTFCYSQCWHYLRYQISKDVHYSVIEYEKTNLSRKERAFLCFTASTTTFSGKKYACSSTGRVVFGARKWLRRPKIKQFEQRHRVGRFVWKQEIH